MLALALLLMMISPILPCHAEQEQVTLNLWVDSLIPNSDMLLDESDWYITKAIQRFNEKHPYIKVDVTKLSGGVESATLFKAAAMAGTAPDVCNVWTGNWTTDLHDVVLILNDLIPPEDREIIGNWEAVSVGFNTENDICGYPLPFQSQAALYYNKDIIAQVGLDFEANPPRTKDDFLAACETIKNAGYTPLVDDMSSSPWSVYFVGLYWWIQQAGNDLLVKENTGEAKYVDDKGLLDALGMYQQMYSKGYLNEDIVSAPDAPNRFLVGQAAMYSNGSWAVEEYTEVLGDKLGMIKAPDLTTDGIMVNGIIGGAGEGLVIWRGTKHPEEAFELVRFLSSKNEYIEYYKTGAGNLPNRTDVTIEDLGLTNPLYEKFFSWAGDVHFFPDNIVDSDAMGLLIRYISDVTVGKMTPEALAQAMDDVVASK